MVALIGWLFVRNDQHGAAHQGFALDAASAVALIGIAFLALKRDGRLWLGGLLAVALLYAIGRYDPWFHMLPADSPHMGGMTPAELAAAPLSEVAIRRGDEPLANIGQRALLRGVHLKRGEVPTEILGGLDVYVVEPKQRKEP
jgi:hypothetical protein